MAIEQRAMTATFPSDIPVGRGHPELKRIPGEAGIWFFIFGDLFIFALFFAVFTVYRGQQPELFLASQVQLNTSYAAFNTLLLLSSSWFVAMGVSAARHGFKKHSCALFLLTLLCGIGFAVIKVLEYSEKVHAGIYLTSNDFYMFYYVFTGIHFVHVIIGMFLLVFMIATVIKSPSPREHVFFFETGASFWHMVDVLWVILFPLIYLLK